MAKIRLIAPVSDIRGQLGNVVYSVWRGTHYTRNMAAGVSNPNSLFQERIRGALTLLSKLWLSTLTDDQRAAWEEYAQGLGSAAKMDRQDGYKNLMPSLGKNLSGKNAYIALNAQLARSDIARIDDAPLGINAPSAPKDTSVAYVVGPPKKLTVTWTDPADLEAGGKVSVWGESPGVFHRQIVATVDKGIQTMDVMTMRGAGGVSMDLVIGLYRFQIVTWDTHGQRSPGGNIVSYNIAS